MTVTIRQAADAGKQLAHQFRSLAVIAEFFEEHASLEQVQAEVKAATDKARRDHAETLANIATERAAVAAQLKTARTALAKVESDRDAALADNKSAETAGKKTLTDQKATIAARTQEIADLDTRLAASKKKVAAFLAD